MRRLSVKFLESNLERKIPFFVNMTPTYICCRMRKRRELLVHRTPSTSLSSTKPCRCIRIKVVWYRILATTSYSGSVRMAAASNMFKPLLPPALLMVLAGTMMVGYLGTQQHPTSLSSSLMARSRASLVSGPTSVRKGLFSTTAAFGLFGGSASAVKAQYPIVGDEQIMSQKEHGTNTKPVQLDLRYGCDRKVADKICSFNRHYAEYSGYFRTTKWLSEVDKTKETTYYDSVTGKPLFIAPKGRTFDEFQRESEAHGWPSFRDEEVVWENVRCLRDGECVSVDGTHLGHNLPDRSGNRYCINLVSVAGHPTI